MNQHKIKVEENYTSWISKHLQKEFNETLMERIQNLETI